MTSHITKTEFLGVSFHAASVERVIASLPALLKRNHFTYIVTPNVDHLVQLHHKPKSDVLWEAYDRADLCLCDSRILQLLAAWSGLKLPLAPGSDITEVLLRQPLPGVDCVAVVGGDAALVAYLQALRPDLSWLHHQPPMGVRKKPASQAAIIEFVERASAQIVFFAIGAPQSELLCRSLALRDRRGAVAFCIGASLEFISGSKRRAPKWMQQARLEWLFRLLAEPRRLARRYMIEGPRIIGIWINWLRYRHRAPA